jgi:hypothetical protein
MPVGNKRVIAEDSAVDIVKDEPRIRHGVEQGLSDVSRQRSR